MTKACIKEIISIYKKDDKRYSFHSDEIRPLEKIFFNFLSNAEICGRKALESVGFKGCGNSVMFVLFDNLNSDFLNDISGLCLSANIAFREGGLAIALFEMSDKPGFGCDVNIPALFRAEDLLFSSNSVMIFEIKPDNICAFVQKCDEYGVICYAVGETGGSFIDIKSAGQRLLSVSLNKAAGVYYKGL